MSLDCSLVMADLRVFPLAAVKFVIGRALVARADAEQRAEGVERVEPPVKAECELIEVSRGESRGLRFWPWLSPNLRRAADGAGTDLCTLRSSHLGLLSD